MLALAPAARWSRTSEQRWIPIKAVYFYRIAFFIGVQARYNGLEGLHNASESEAAEASLRASRQWSLC